VIVSEGFFQWTPAALLAAKRLGTAIVVAYERTAHTERNASWWRTCYRQFVGRQIDAIACNGRLSRDYCQAVLGVSPDRIVTGAMAADSDELARKALVVSPREIAEQRSVWRAADDGPVLLYVGQLIRRKGLRELLAAWELHRAKDGRGTLVLVGDGRERERSNRSSATARSPASRLAGRRELRRHCPLLRRRRPARHAHAGRQLEPGRPRGDGLRQAGPLLDAQRLLAGAGEG
jgi:glycosyltransferase involved in cell wall biosynthesis